MVAVHQSLLCTLYQLGGCCCRQKLRSRFHSARATRVSMAVLFTSTWVRSSEAGVKRVSFSSDCLATSRSYLQVPSFSKLIIVHELLHRISVDAFGAATLRLTLTRHWNCNGCNGRSVLLLLMSTRCTFRSIKRAKNALNCCHRHKDWHRPTVACHLPSVNTNESPTDIQLV